MNMFFKSILAGMLISIGCVIYMICEIPIVGAIFFALGLYTICMFKLYLFTGKIGYALDKQISIEEYCYILFGNFIGTTFVASCISCTRLFNTLYSKASNIVSIKQNDTCLSLFILGIFCGMIMYICVEGFKTTNNPLVIFIGIPVFILCGFEHCVADMFYISFSGFYNYTPEMIIKLLFIILGNGIGSIFIREISK